MYYIFPPLLRKAALELRRWLRRLKRCITLQSANSTNALFCVTQRITEPLGEISLPEYAHDDGAEPILLFGPVVVLPFGDDVVPCVLAVQATPSIHGGSVAVGPPKVAFGLTERVDQFPVRTGCSWSGAEQAPAGIPGTRWRPRGGPQRISGET